MASQGFAAEKLTVKPLSLRVNTLDVNGDIVVRNQGDLRLYETGATPAQYTGFQAPSSLGSNYLYTLPSNYGSSGQMLSTNGSGTLSWATAGGLFTDNGAYTYLTSAADDLYIGGTSPDIRLDDTGSAVFNENSASVDFRVESNTLTHALFVDGSANGVGIGGVTSVLDPLHVKADSGGDNIHLEEYSGGEDWQIGIDSAGSLSFQDEGTTRVFFQDNTGNVGIGTAAPSAKLDVVGTSEFNGTHTVTGTTYLNGAAVVSGDLGVRNGALGVYSWGTMIEGNTSSYALNVENTYTGGSEDGIRITIYDRSATSSNRYIEFKSSGGSYNAGEVYGSGDTAVVYSTSSDRRLKGNIRDTRYGIEDLMRVKVRDYNFISDGLEKTGFIAQELYEIYPEAVKVGGEDPKQDPWGVGYANVTPLLAKAIQDLKVEKDAEIAELKAENTELRSLIEQMNGRLTALEN